MSIPLIPRGTGATIDRLAEVRASIANLKVEEKRLRATLLGLPDGEFRGPHSKMRIVTSGTRRLDRAKLPQWIVEDPDHWITGEVRAIRILSDTRSAAPDWPDDDLRIAPIDNRADLRAAMVRHWRDRADRAALAALP